MKLPQIYVDRMKELLKDDYQVYIDSFEDKRIYGLRLNNLKTDSDAFLKITDIDLQKVPWIENGYFYNEDIKPAKHPHYFAGLYYIQEPSAMTPASRLPIDKGDYVLDMCSAPGGKSTELASKLGNTGLLVSNDISNSRLKALVKNLEVWGAGNILVLNEDPVQVAKTKEEYFDKILIDAPCSGEGMFRKDNKLIKAWERSGPEFYSNIQKNLIVAGADMLKPGGMMLYSTCTFSKEEDEEVVAHLLSEREDMELVDIEGYEGFSKGFAPYERCVRIFPHKMQGEGHFLALFKKRGEKMASVYASPYRYKLPSCVAEFLSKLKVKFDTDNIYEKNGYVYYSSRAGKDFDDYRVLRNGLLLGIISKDRFEPSQALAMYLKMDEYDNCLNLPLNDMRVIKYLKGETIEYDEEIEEVRDDYVLICCDGYPLGFGKAKNGIIKNKYLPGWRWM